MKNNKMSTERLDLIPDVNDLKRICISIALLESILNIEEFRFEQRSDTYIYDNGSGDNFKIRFNDTGATIAGFNHESPMSPFGDDFNNYFIAEDDDDDYDPEEGVSDNYDDEIECWPGLIENLPNEFYNFVNNFYDAAEEKVWLTFCIWRKYSDPSWQIGNMDLSKLGNYPNPDGSERLLYFLDGKPETYLEWTSNSYRDEEEEQYYLDIDIVNHFFQHKPITDELLKKIHRKLSLKKLSEKISEFGYPLIKNLE